MEKSSKASWLFIIIIIAFFLSDRVIAFCLDGITSRSQIRFSKLYRGTIDASIVILGNSRGVNSFFSPAIQKRSGLKAFNLSYNGMSISIARDLFIDYLEHNRRPSILVLEISCLHSSDELINNLKQYVHKSKRIEKQFKQYNKSAYYASLLFHTYRFNSEYFLRTLYYLNRSDQIWINRYMINEAYYRNYSPKNLDRQMFSYIDPEDLSVVKEILDVAQKNEIEVRLFISPYLNKYIEGIPMFVSWKKKLEVALQTNLWDYASAIYDWHYFADALHLNYEGSIILLDKLYEDGFFNFIKDPRNIYPN